MTLRRRIVLLSAAAVAVAIALAGAVTYVVVRQQLRGGVDDALRAAVPRIELGRGARLVVPGPAFEAPAAVAIAPDGDVLGRTPGAVLLAPGDEAFEDRTIDGTRVRVLTTTGPLGGTLVIARPLTATDDALADLRLVLLLVTLGGVALAAGLGVLVARGTLAPLQRVTAAAERVASTGELAHRLDEGRDELGRLSATFNRMLGALQRSRDAQRRLVSDASHELRTPLTAVRANVELLERADALPAGERREVVRAVSGQLEELTVIVGDLVDLARDGDGLEREPLALDEVAGAAVERARRLAPGLDWRLDAAPARLEGDRARVHRAVMNLLDNAAKWSPPGAAVDVRVHPDGVVEVRDRGPGIPEDDLPLVFDRFHRAAEARGLPGSGLGLAIVRQVAEAHGGWARAENAPGGGALLRVRFSPSS